MASTAPSSATSIRACGDRKLNEVEPIQRPADVQSAVPRSAGGWETLLYAVTFLAAFGYAASDFYLNIGRSPKKSLHRGALVPGWLSDWTEDAQNLESDLIKGYKFLIVVGLGFLLVSQVTIRLGPQWIHYLAIAGYTLATTAAVVGHRSAMYMLLLHCSAVCMAYFSQAGVWLLILTAMVLQNSDNTMLYRFLDHRGVYGHLYYPINGYLYCRSISAGLSLNRILQQQRQEAADGAPPPSLLQFLGLHLPRALAYGFYLPWHFAGPILTFPEFCREAEKADRLVWNWKLVLLLVWRATRLLVWLLLLQVLHHFLPVGAFLQSIQSYDSVPYKRLVFSMYLHGQNFMLVYVQLYGWPGLVSRIDGIELPHWPDCISRVYTYRQMWRVFDRGLASFMHCHIYLPMGGSRHGILRQVAAVVASFAFVSIYHGDSNSVRVWCALNAMQLLLETMACVLYEAKLKAWLIALLGPVLTQRMVAAAMAQNLILSYAILLTFFFPHNSSALASLLVKPMTQGPLWHRLGAWWCLVFFYYCAVQLALGFESGRFCPATKTAAHRADKDSNKDH